MANVKLSEYAKKNGISYLTANRWYHNDQIPGAFQTESGTILVDENAIIKKDQNEAISLLLKKTVEFSNNNASIEDFSSYIINNFNLQVQDPSILENKTNYPLNWEKLQLNSMNSQNAYYMSNSAVGAGIGSASITSEPNFSLSACAPDIEGFAQTYGSQINNFVSSINYISAAPNTDIEEKTKPNKRGRGRPSKNKDDK